MSSEFFGGLSLAANAAAERERLAREAREKEKRKQLADLDASRGLLERARKAAETGAPAQRSETKLDGERHYVFEEQAHRAFSDEDVKNAAVDEGNAPVIRCERIELFDGLTAAPSPLTVQKAAALQDALSRLENAAPETDEAKRALEAFLTFAEERVQDDAIDPDEFARSLGLRLDALIALLRFRTPADAEAEADYRGLCRLLRCAPVPLDPAAREKEIERMQAELTRRNSEAYISDALAEALAALGMEVVGSEVLDGLPGTLLEDADAPGVAVFMSRDGDGLLFETVATEQGANTEDRQAGAKHICNKHKQLIELLRQKGVILRVTDCVEPDGAQLRVIPVKATEAPAKRKRAGRRRAKDGANEQASEE